MRLVTYDRPGHGPRAGVLLGDVVVVDADRCAREATLESAVDWTSVKALLAAAGVTELEALEAAADRLLDRGDVVPRADVRLLPPIPDPEKIVCIGLNYRDHVEEAQREVATLGTQKDPVVFSKFNSALIADGEPIVLPAAAPNMIDWEGELAVVVGRRCKHVSAEDALGYVAGYTVLNDVSARDLQLASPQWLMDKSVDTSGPIGPWIVTADEIVDPQDLELTTTLNGVVVQQTSTSLMIHPVARLIEYISSLITLEPGDLIATGTPAGVGFSRDPQVFLADGDIVTVTVSGVGELTNPVRSA